MKYISTFLLLFIIIGISFPSIAQINPASVNINNLSDAQIKRLMAEIQSRGLSQEQAIVFAKAQGATQAQIDQLMVRMQQMGTGATTGTKTEGTETETKMDTYVTPKVAIEVSEKTKRIFGYQLFNSEKLTFEPGVNIPVPQNYILGIGDQIAINVWGASQSTVQLTIDKSGAVNIPDVGPVYLNGISYKEGQSQIRKRLMAIYSGMAGEFPNTWAEITLGGIRSIKVSVIGEINAPGTYSLPATATAFNALYLSGGPNENGSMREIRLIRDGVTFKTIDVYDFLINADPAANVQLREQDILYVPNYKTHVEFAGEVKRKGIFEMKNKETLSDLIRFAGGFGDMAYTKSLRVLRKNNKEREIRSVNDADYVKFVLQNGDSIKADSLLNRYSNRVVIEGAVFHPGDYELTPGMKISDLIKNADGLLEDAFLNRGLVSRMKDDNSLVNINFDVRQVLEGKNDFLLQKEDLVTIRSIFEMREEQTVKIEGEVNKPKSFPYQDNMTINDLIFKAGGFREGADLSVVEVTRRLNYEEAAQVTNQMSKIYKFTLQRDLQLSPIDAQFKLSPFDQVYVRKAPGFNEQGTFNISGEVVYAGIYAIIEKNERISDALNRAGGLVPGAYTIGATLTRTIKLSVAEIEAKNTLMKKDTTLIFDIKANNESNRIGINLDKIMANPGSTIDLLLQPGDSLHIPRILQTIKVSGNVMNPIALTFEKNLSIKRYINMAGGYRERSKKSKTYVIYPNGTTAATKSFIIRKNPKIMPGSEIIVPQKPENKDESMKWISIASAVSSLALSIVVTLNYLKL